ncbi:OB-fold domain-containing protein [Amycolatopsis thermoflava]|uniref:OB-fold domain-containing protein n=1 Tax=Amycolatopsis thermoflava TaxID=84480 RepID=UPI0038109DC8
MTQVSSVGTYLPCWGSALRRQVGDDEDALTLAVEAGRAALDGAAGVERVIVISRDLPLLEGGNAAVLLAGLGLDPEIEVGERLGGAPAALDALTSARPRTLVIGTDLEPAGAGAALTGDEGLSVRLSARLARSLPVRTRDAAGTVHDYGDPRLLRERGLLASVAAAGVEKPVAVAGADRKLAGSLCAGLPPELPTVGASAPFFALAAMVREDTTGTLLAVEQASLTGVVVETGTVRVNRREPQARPMPRGRDTPGAEIPISLAAYDRAFEPKLRWEAGRHPGRDELDFPPRYHVGRDGSLSTDYTLVPLPRTGTVYTGVTVHVPVPGLRTPYSLVIVELDGVEVRALVKVTGTEPGTVGIGDRGRMVLRRVAVRSGVPDYGYAFQPEGEA